MPFNATSAAEFRNRRLLGLEVGRNRRERIRVEP